MRNDWGTQWRHHDEDTAELRKPLADQDAEEDEGLIAAGFALLYITGNIDDEGRRWLKGALQRV